MSVASLRARLRARFEDPNPILLRELRAIFRTPLFVRFLSLATGFLSLIVLASGAAMTADHELPAEVGQSVYQVFFVLTLVILCVVAPAHGATTITSEREGMTYETLILSGMDPWRIVVGKFLASYVAIALVVVSFVPIVGVSFLFGGISPVDVVLGFGVLAVVLAPSVALGTAVSSRARTTRIATLLSLLVWFPWSLVCIGVMTAVGEASSHSATTNLNGPFAFVGVLANAPFDPAVVLPLFVLPTLVAFLLAWFFFCVAAAGVRPEAEDRVTPFRNWALATTATFLIGEVVLLSLVDATDLDGAAPIYMMAFAWLPLFFALLFVNEPPLPPLRVTDTPPSGLGERVSRFFGPGALGTSRTGALVITLTCLGAALVAVVVLRLRAPTMEHRLATEVACVAMAVSTLVVCLAVLYVGAWLRTVVRNGNAVRALLVAALVIVQTLAFLAAAALEWDAFERTGHELATALKVGPLAPGFVGGVVLSSHDASKALFAAPAVALYGLAALLGYLGLVRGVRRAAARVEERRRAHEAVLEERAARELGHAA